MSGTRGRIIAAVLGLVVIVLLWYQFLYKPATNDVSDAQSQLESLTLLPGSDPTLAPGYAGSPTPFRYKGATLGSEGWRVIAYDEPHIPGPSNLRRVIVTVRWHQGVHTDSLSLERLWPS